MTQANAEKKAGRYHHGNLKASLIEAALIILERDGADALSLRAIAAEVGVSHTASYSHFKNKKELIEAITEQGYEQLAIALREGVETDEEDIILSYGASYLRFAINNPQLYRLMLGQVETRGLKDSPKHAPRPVTLDVNKERQGDNGITLKPAYRLLNQAMEEELQNPQLAKQQALGAWGLVHGLSALLIEGHITLPDDTDLKTFLASVAWHRS